MTLRQIERIVQPGIVTVQDFGVSGSAPYCNGFVGTTHYSGPQDSRIDSTSQSKNVTRASVLQAIFCIIRQMVL